jgi:hypothetical protein
MLVPELSIFVMRVISWLALQEGTALPLDSTLSFHLFVDVSHLEKDLMIW